MLGAWAYAAMVDLGLSDEQIAERADTSAGHIRKIMGGSEREPSARVLRAMYRYFQEVGAERGIPIDKPPGLDMDPARGNDTSSLAGSAYLTRVDALIGVVSEFLAELRAARQGQDATEARLRAVEAELESLRAAPKAGASQGRSARHAKAG